MVISTWFSCQKNISFVDEYERPTNPGALNIQAKTAHIKALTMRDYHREDVAIFRKTVDVEKSLKNPFVAVI